MYIKTCIFFFLFYFVPARAKAQLQETSFAQLDSLQKADGRKVIVFLEAQWCNWCGAMKQTTFKDRDVVRMINSRYYFISFNIENKNTLTFKGRSYLFKETGRNTGRHELADVLGTGTLPTISVLNKANEIIYQYSGYLSARDFSKLLHAIGDTPFAK